MTALLLKKRSLIFGAIVAASFFLVGNRAVLAHTGVGTTNLFLYQLPAGNILLNNTDSCLNLSGSTAPDVACLAVTTTTLHTDQINEGRVNIQIATDGVIVYGTPNTVNAVPSGDIGLWVTVHRQDADPDHPVKKHPTTEASTHFTRFDFDVDAGALTGAIVVETSPGVFEEIPVSIIVPCDADDVGFRAQYETGGGKHKVSTHESAPVDICVDCPEV